MTGSTTGGTPEAAAEAVATTLAATVDRLRDELDGLRQAMRSRALIEQAKGMLMERYGCTPEDAFTRLTTLSQHANIKLADVASALVATSARPDAPPTPPAPSPAAPAAASPRAVEAAVRRSSLDRWPREAGGDSSFASQVRARARRARIRSDLLSARSADEVIAAVTTALAESPPSAVALAGVDVSGALVLLGSSGIAPGVAARWQRVPVDVPLPVCLAARTGESRWWQDDDPARSAMLGLGLPEPWRTAAILPLPHDGGHRGVLALTWPADGDTLGPQDRRDVEGLARAVAATLPRLAAGATSIRTRGAVRPAERSDPVLALLDLLWQPILLCDMVIGRDRTVEDLVLRHLNPAASRGAHPRDLIGRRLIELFPDTLVSGLFGACLQVWETGAQVDLAGHVSRLTDGPAGEPADVRLTRYRDGVLITWQNRPDPNGDPDEAIA